jgi:hypothetical protein
MNIPCNDLLSLSNPKGNAGQSCERSAIASGIPLKGTLPARMVANQRRLPFQQSAALSKYLTALGGRGDRRVVISAFERNRSVHHATILAFNTEGYRRRAAAQARPGRQ